MNCFEQSDQNGHRELVDVAVAEYLRRTDDGEVVNRDHFLRKYPDVADGVREFFEHYDTVSELVRSI